MEDRQMARRKKSTERSAAVREYLARNAREYPDSVEGKLINVAAVSAKFGISITFFRKRYEHKLQSFPQRLPRFAIGGGRSRGFEAAYLEAEVAELLRARQFCGEFNIGGRCYLDRQATLRRLGICQTRLFGFAVSFPFGEPSLLHPVELRSEATGVLQHAWPAENVARAKEALNQAANGQVTLPNGKTYLSPLMSVRRVFGRREHGRQLTAHRIGRSDGYDKLARWHRIRCHWLARRLEAIRLPNLSGGKTSCLWFLENDILQIKKEIAARLSPAATARHRVEESDDGYMTLPQAAKLVKAPLKRLRQWVRLGLPEPMAEKCEFADGRIPTARRPLLLHVNGATVKHWRYVISPVVAGKVKNALESLEREALQRTGRETAGEICNRLGIVEANDRAAIQVFLECHVPSKRETRGERHRGHVFQVRATYDFENVRRSLNGHELVDAARAFRAKLRSGLAIRRRFKAPALHQPGVPEVTTQRDDNPKRRGRPAIRDPRNVERDHAIREKWESGSYTQKQLAAEYHISRSMISDIVTGRYENAPEKFAGQGPK
jgi:hypothetical protein